MHSCFCAPLLSLSVLCRSYLKNMHKKSSPPGQRRLGAALFCCHWSLLYISDSCANQSVPGLWQRNCVIVHIASHEH